MRLGALLVDYFDLLVAAGLAVVFTYLGARNQLKGDELTQAASVLLGALSFVIFRERWERAKASESVERAVASFGIEKPWQVLDEILTWDIRSPSSASTVSQRDIRFLGTEVFTIHEFERGTSGSVTQRRARGAVRGEQLQPLQVVEPGILGPEGRVYHVIVLDGMRRRGDRMDLRYERQLTNSFLADRENVGVVVQNEIDRLVVRVQWPDGKRPTSVRLERPDRESKSLEPKIRSGRATIQETIDHPELGDVINITWTW